MRRPLPEDEGERQVDRIPAPGQMFRGQLGAAPQGQGVQAEACGYLQLTEELQEYLLSPRWTSPTNSPLSDLLRKDRVFPHPTQHQGSGIDPEDAAGCGVRHREGGWLGQSQGHA